MSDRTSDRTKVEENLVEFQIWFKRSYGHIHYPLTQEEVEILAATVYLRGVNDGMNMARSIVKEIG